MSLRSWPVDRMWTRSCSSTFVRQQDRKRNLPVWKNRGTFALYRRKWKCSNFTNLAVHPNTLRRLASDKCLQRAIGITLALYILVRFALESLDSEEIYYLELHGGKMSSGHLRQFLHCLTPGRSKLYPLVTFIIRITI